MPHLTETAVQDTAIRSRIEAIQESSLNDLLEQALADFHDTVPTDPPPIKQIYLVGSVLTDEFTSTSDIDIIIGTSQRPHEHVREHFFRYVHRYGENLLSEELPFQFTYVDICMINTSEYINNNISDPYWEYNTKMPKMNTQQENHHINTK